MLGVSVTASSVVAPSGHHFHIAYSRLRYARPALRKFREWLAGQLQPGQTDPEAPVASEKASG